MFEAWPFTNFHDLNLDWLISKWKKLEDNLDDIHASMDAAAASAEVAAEKEHDAKNHAAEAMAYKDLARGYAEDADESAELLTNALDQIAVNTARIDAWTTAQTPDANTELLDERVEFTGFTNASAGDATRAQGAFGFEKLGHLLFNGMEQVNISSVTAGYYAPNGTIATAGGTTKEVYTSKITIKHGEAFLIVYELPSNRQAWFAAGLFDAGDNWLNRPTFASGTDSQSQLYTTATENGRVLYYGLYQPAANANAKTVSFTYRTYGAEAAVNIYRIPLAKINAISTMPAPLLMGDAAAAKTIDVDTTNHTVTIPGDTLLLWPDTYPNHMSETPTQDTSTGWRRLSTVNTPIVLTYNNVTPPGSSTPSTAIVGIYNAITESVETVTFNNPLVYSPYTAVLFTLRWNTNSDLISFSCASPYRINNNLFGIDVSANTVNTPWRFTPCVESVNHRGYNTIAPENTLPAFKLSKKMGFDTIECDIQLTSDGVPVVLHDGTINRTARLIGGGTIPSTINVFDVTYQDLIDNYDFGIWKSAQYANTPIPTWQELCVLARALGLKIYVEIKGESPWTNIKIQEVMDIAEQCGVKDNIIYISYSHVLLGHVRAYDANAKIYIVASNITAFNRNNALTLKAGLDIDYNNVTDADVVSLISDGTPLAVWTVDTVSDLETLNPYIDSVTSNIVIAAKELYDNNI